MPEEKKDGKKQEQPWENVVFGFRVFHLVTMVSSSCVTITSSSRRRYSAGMMRLRYILAMFMRGSFRHCNDSMSVWRQAFL